MADLLNVSFLKTVVTAKHYICSFVSGYNMSSKDVKTEESKILTYHHIVEAFKFAYAKRTQMGDPAFVDLKQVTVFLRLIFSW